MKSHAYVFWKKFVKVWSRAIYLLSVKDFLLLTELTESSVCLNGAHSWKF